MLIMVLFVILILVVCRGCTWRLMGNIPKNKAAFNLEQYLLKKHKGKLGYKELDRFFNAGNMNPNMFRALIYDRIEPEINFIYYFDAKKIVESNNTVPHTDFEDLYKKAVVGYKARQKIRAHFKDRISKISFTVFSVEATVSERLDSKELNSLIRELVGQMNNYHNELHIQTTLSILIKTYDNPLGFIKIPLCTDNQKWTVQSVLLSEKAKQFSILKKKVIQHIEASLIKSHPNLEIYQMNTVYVDPNLMTVGAWVQLLSDKTINNEEKGVWKDPVKAFYIAYFNVGSGNLMNCSVQLRHAETLSYLNELQRIKDSLVFPKVTVDPN